MSRRSVYFGAKKPELLGSFKPNTKHEPQSNDTHRASIDFNGSNEYLANTTQQTIGITGTWSVAAWFRLDSVSSEMSIVRVTDATASNNLIDIEVQGGEAGDPIQIFVTDSGGTTIQNKRFSVFVGTARWHHVVLTWDGTDTVFYLDGRETSATTTTTDSAGTMTDSNRGIRIGSDHAGNTILNGGVQSASIWDVVLTGDEVIQIFNHGCGGAVDLANNHGDYASAANLQHWWRVGFDASDIGKDYGYGTAIDVMDNASNISSDDVRGFGPDGAYVDLNGSNEYYRNTTAQSIGVANEWTVAGWFRSDGITSNDTPFHIGHTSGNSQILIEMTGALSDGRLRVFITDSSGSTIKDYSWLAVFSLVQWVHVTATWDGTTLKAYRNGVDLGDPDVTDTDSTGVMADDDRKVGIGMLDNNPSPFLTWNGGIHSVAVWNRAMPATAIKAVYNGGFKDIDLTKRALQYNYHNKLAHWWRCGQPTSSTFGTGQTLCVDYVASGGIDVEANSNGITFVDVFVEEQIARGTSISLDGSTEYLGADSAVLGFADSWTISTWYYTDKNNVWEIVFDTSAASNVSRLQIALRGDDPSPGLGNDPQTNGVQIFLGDSSGGTLKNWYFKSGFTTNTWYNLIATWDGSTLTIYRNGVDVTSSFGKVTDAAGSMADSSRQIYVGRNWAADNRYFSGYQSSTAIWNTALSSDEVAEVYSSRNSIDLRYNRNAYVSGANLVHWWKLGEDSDSIGKDFAAGSTPTVSVDELSTGITTDNIFGESPQ